MPTPAPDNRQIQFTEQNYYYPPRYRIGEEVEVMYDPQNFQKARVWSDRSEMNYPAAYPLITGLVFILVSLFITVTAMISSR